MLRVEAPGILNLLDSASVIDVLQSGGIDVDHTAHGVREGWLEQLVHHGDVRIEGCIDSEGDVGIFNITSESISSSIERERHGTDCSREIGVLLLQF